MSDFIRPISMTELSDAINQLPIPITDKMSFIGEVHRFAAVSQRRDHIDTQTEFAQVYMRLTQLEGQFPAAAANFKATAAAWLRDKFQPAPSAIPVVSDPRLSEPRCGDLGCIGGGGGGLVMML